MMKKLHSEYYCRYCNSKLVKAEFHEGKQQMLIRCESCNKATWWPKEQSKKRESVHLNLVRKKGLDYCQWCLREKSNIPPPGTLEGHHIIEYSDEKLNDLDNILVLCTACHKQCHHDRTYYGHYKPTQ